MPILKAKPAEFDALSRLSADVRARIVPLFEVNAVPPRPEVKKPRSFEQQMKDFADRVLHHWGSEPGLVDLEAVATHRFGEEMHPLEGVLRDCEDRGLHLLPVTGLRRDAAYQRAIAAVTASRGVGVCLRLVTADFAGDDLHAVIADWLAMLKLKPSDVDLLVDLGDVADLTIARHATPSILSKLPSVWAWKTFSLAGASFPQQLHHSGLVAFPRIEWGLWSLVGSVQGRQLTFSDYAIQWSGPVFSAGRASIPNVRYTTADSFLTFRGKSTQRAGSGQEYVLADQVVRHAAFSGPTFSDGDRYISEVARQVEGPGGATQWRAAGTNHHITFVVHQLQARQAAA